MLYRVDYALGILLAGFVGGLAAGRRVPPGCEHRVSLVCYWWLAALSSIRVLAYSAVFIFGPHPAWVQLFGNAVGDVLALSFAAAVGLAACQPILARNPMFLNAMFLAVAFSFATSGIAKALSPSSIEPFFRQSGYTPEFLRFIDLAEVFGGMGLLLSWARVPAMLGLMVDMFGAIVTHIHNGDPVNDSTGAIGMLIRLMALGVLYGISKSAPERSKRRVVLIVLSASTICLFLAVSGAQVSRRAAGSSLSPGSLDH